VIASKKKTEHLMRRRLGKIRRRRHCSVDDFVAVEILRKFDSAAVYWWPCALRLNY